MVNNTLEYIIQKYSLNIGRQYEVSIPNMGRLELAALLGEMEFDLGAEIGVGRGSFSEILCKQNPKLHLYCIDSWDAPIPDNELTQNPKDQKMLELDYEEAVKKLAPYRCEIIKKDSQTASLSFPNESLDFVYIDANHELPNITADIATWSKKVRPGGIISGSSYAFFPSKRKNHVKYAVQAYTRAYGIVPHFIVGAEAVGEPNIIRDTIRSWFWVKS